MINTQTLKGNLINQDYTTAFTLNQGDKGVPFKIELLENGTSYTLLSTDTVSIEWLKPNGQPFLQDGNIKYGTNYIEITTPEAIAQYSGSGTFNIIISDGDVRKGTIRREYKVIPTSFKPGSISEDVITDAITELRELSVEIADTVQNNQELINNNQVATQNQVNTINTNINSINTNINNNQVATQNQINTINTNINNINSSLEEKANKNEVFSMANMGQDIRESMTGGSVAVVGLNTVMVGNLNKNISDSLCEYKTVSLETQNGYYDASLNFVSFSSWRCGEISVSTGDRFIVSGANTNATYNFISIVDKDNNIIDSLAGGVEYTDKEFIIPSGGYKMYISYVYSTHFSLSKADIMKFNSIVNGLTSDVDNLNFNIFNGYKDVSSGFTWVLGGVNGNNGTNVTANYITRVNMFTGDDKEKQFTFDDGYEVGIYVFDNSKTFESYTTYKINNFRYEFLSEKQYKLTFRKSSDTTEITDISDFVSNLSIKDVYDVTTLNPFLKERFGLLEKVKGKTWNPIGDSITAGFLYQPLVVRDTGIVCNGNYGVSGSTVAVNANSSAVGQSFYERVVKNTLYPVDADIWTIYGGINDMMSNTPIGESTSKDSTTFYGALNLIVEYILKLENSPKLLLYNILPSYRDDRTNDLGLTMSNYREAITTVGKRYNIRVVQLQEVSGMNSVNRSKFTRDGLHPNEAGTNFYYHCLKNPILDCF